MLASRALRVRASPARLHVPRRAYTAPAPAEPAEAAYRILQAYRTRGHEHAHCNPLDASAPEIPSAFPWNAPPAWISQPFPKHLLGSVYGLTSNEGATPTFGDVVAHLRGAYTSHIGLETEGVAPAEAEWLHRAVEEGSKEEPSAQARLQLLRQMAEAEWLDHFIARKYASVKRYGLEGAESFIPLMDAVLAEATAREAHSVVLSIPHRGRLNLLTGLLKFPLPALCHKLKGGAEIPLGVRGIGDVLSHLATSVDLTYPVTDGSRLLHVAMLHNPSHLEASTPVAMGKARAKQARTATTTSDASSAKGVVPVLVHGDAAFAGQGVIPESLQLSYVPGFQVQGSIHVIVNNQLGFTTAARHARSTRHSSDWMRAIRAPVIHVNAEAPEAVARVGRMAGAFRQTFGKDILVDLLAYRRHGHNELDEPAFTQPLMYTDIRSRKSVVALYAERLARQALPADEFLNEHRTRVTSELDEAFAASKSYEPRAMHLEGSLWSAYEQAQALHKGTGTGVATDVLHDVGKRSVAVPKGFAVHTRLERLFMAPRLQRLSAGESLDWATCEALAFGSLLVEGYHVRLSGQDVGRGTFSHRHVLLTDQLTEQEYMPLQHLRAAGSQGRFEAVNSPLSEMAVMGYEYGYSIADPRTLVLWEAQFGDFVNGAQIIIDQFLASGEDKWLRQSALVLLLPHGYDGAGPEHSSCRLERFLQLCDSDALAMQSDHIPNMLVVNPTTPANYFHALRRQMVAKYRKPLIVVGPKTLLRHPDALSSLAELGPDTSFRAVLPDPVADPTAVKRVLFCSGKIYYELSRKRNEKNVTDTAIVRLEELSPFPFTTLQAEIARYPNATSYAWVQEEQQNAGAFLYVQPRFKHLVAQLEYHGRGPLSSPAVGMAPLHSAEVNALFSAIFP